MVGVVVVADKVSISTECSTTTDAFDFLFTVSNGLCEAAEELVVLGQSEGGAFWLLMEMSGYKTVGQVKHKRKKKKATKTTMLQK